MTETEILLQLWADTLADVQADKTFMQQTERAAQNAAFRVRAGAVRAEVMRRLQKAGANRYEMVPRLYIQQKKCRGQIFERQVAFWAGGRNPAPFPSMIVIFHGEKNKADEIW